MKTVLLVCTGNTCRSSMAEALLKHLVSERTDALKDLRVISAGTSAVNGQMANPQAIKIMEEMGLNLREHRSQPLTQSLIAEADIILTMEEWHRDIVIAMDSQAAGKTYTLKEYGMDNSLVWKNIMDPFGGSLDVYRESAKEIRENLERVIVKL